MRLSATGTPKPPYVGTWTLNVVLKLSANRLLGRRVFEAHKLNGLRRGNVRACGVSDPFRV